MTYPDAGLSDVNAHLDALFLIADAEAGNIARIRDRIPLTLGQDNAAAVMLYLASYSASLLRRLRQLNALPSEPGKFLGDIETLVANTVPRPE